MHELALWAIPVLGVPILGIRTWFARRRMKSYVGDGLPLGETLHAVGTLPAANGAGVNIADLAGAKAIVLVFMSNRCPGVKAYDSRLNTLHRRFAPQGVRFIGVNSVPQQLYPGESLAGMARAAQARGVPFPYVKDADQQLMRLMGAVCTPQVFVLDEDLVLRYRGRIDDAFIESKARMHDLRDALNDVLAGRPVGRPESAPLGCTIDIAPSISSALPSNSRSIPA